MFADWLLVVGGLLLIRLIHRHKKKRGSLYLLPVPQLEALALPIKVERATQKPTPNMLQCHAVHKTMANIHIPHRTSTVASSLTLIENLLDSKLSRTKRQVNAFLYVMCSLPYTYPHSEADFCQRTTANIHIISLQSPFSQHFFIKRRLRI